LRDEPCIEVARSIAEFPSIRHLPGSTDDAALSGYEAKPRTNNRTVHRQSLLRAGRLRNQHAFSGRGAAVKDVLTLSVTSLLLLQFIPRLKAAPGTSSCVHHPEYLAQRIWLEILSAGGEDVERSAET
jgi:hypothetical protein